MSDPTPVPGKPAALWEDLVDVFVAPAELFRRRVDGKFGLALLVLVVLTAVLFFATRDVMQPIFDAEFTRGMAANPNLTAEQAEAARKFTTTFAPVMVLIGLPVGVLVLGIVVWIVGRIVGARIGYMQGATIATFAMFPRLVESVAGAVQAFLMDESALTSRFVVSLGLGRFLDPQSTGAVLLAFLGRVDVFTIWVTVLIAVGLKQMGRITTAQAAAGAAVIWVLGAFPTLLGALQAK